MLAAERPCLKVLQEALDTVSLTYRSRQRLGSDGLRCCPSFAVLPKLFSWPSQLTCMRGHLPRLTFITLSSTFDWRWPTRWHRHTNISSMQYMILLITVAWTRLTSSARTTLNLCCSRTQHWSSCGWRFSNWSSRHKLEWRRVCRRRIIPGGIGVPSPVASAARFRAMTARARCSRTSHRDGSWRPQVTSSARFCCGSWLAATGCFFAVTWRRMSHVRSGSCWSPWSRVIWRQRGVGTVWHGRGFGSLLCSGRFRHVVD